jgi:hypothetical protein
MVITFLNFSTALIAEYIQHPEQEQVAAVVYTGTMLVIAALWNVLWRYLLANRHLLGKNTDEQMIRTISSRYRWAALYAVAFVLAFVSAPASLALVFFMAVFFALTGSRR